MKINKVIKSRNKVFYSWMTSYAVVLILPIIIGSLVYWQSIRVINGEVNRAHDASLMQVKTLLDGNLEEIKRIGNEISLNDKVKSLMYLKTPMQPWNKYSLYELQKDLIKFKISNTFISGIYLYFRNNDFILSNSERTTAKDYEKFIKDNFGMRSEDWLQLIRSSTTREHKIIRVDKGDGNFETKVIFIQPVPSISVNSPGATAVILIDGEKFNQALQNVQWVSQGMISVVNSKNEFLSTGRVDVLPDFLQYQYLTDAESLFHNRLFEDKVAVTHIPSAIYDWEYVSVIPTKVFLNKVQYIKFIILIYVIICLIVGCLIVGYFVYRNYRPLKKLTQIVRNNSEKYEESGYNEFSFLEDSLLKLLDEKKSLKYSLKQQKEAMKNNFLLRLMKGRITDIATVTDSCALYDVHFKSDYFLVMIFRIEGFNHTFSEEKPEDVNLANYIIQNITEELVSEKHLGFMTEMDGMMSCLVNLLPKTGESVEYKDFKDEIDQIVFRDIELLEKKFGLTLSVVVSGIHSKVTGIAKAYSEAMEVMEYKMLVDEVNPVMHYSTIFYSGKPGIKDSDMFNKERQFTNCILAKDYKNAGMILNDIIGNDILKTTPSLQIVKCRIFGLLNSMLNAIGEIRTNMDVKLFDDVDMVKRLLDSRTISELQKQVNYIFDSISEYYHENKENNSVHTKYDEIVEFVRNHYVDPEISISMISDQFDISISSISRIFKKNMGIGLLDYIHKLRIEKAKELIKSTEMSFKDVAERVGYYNNVAMIRAFKRYEGITPGKYRDIE